MLNSTRLLTILGASVLSSQALEIWKEESILPKLNADPDTVTVSGHSAGAHYANHLLIVLSDTFKGAGMSKGSTFLSKFGKFKDPNMQYLVTRPVNLIKELDDANEIDSVSNLQDRAVCIMSGSNDKVVPPHNQEAAKLQFEAFDMTNILFDTRDSGHGFAQGAAHFMIEYLYQALGYSDSLVSDVNNNIDWTDPSVGKLSSFSQVEFYPSSIDWTKEKNFKGREMGYIYVPKACETTQCKMHFALHGHNGNVQNFAKKYHKFAALNNIIMVYPDTKSWENFVSTNDSENFMKNTGVMPTAFKKMIERLASSDEPDEPDEPNSELIEWLEAQENCIDQFRIHVVEDDGTPTMKSGRLFHGHYCTTYTLVSQIQLPLGTWGSDAITGFSQEPDGPCEQVSDQFEQCNFTLPPNGQKLAISFAPEFDLSQITHTNNWQQ